MGEVDRDKGLAVEVNWELCMGKLGEAEVQMISSKELEGSIQQPSHAAGWDAAQHTISGKIV